jgi:hypothetical protein
MPKASRGRVLAVLACLTFLATLMAPLTPVPAGAAPVAPTGLTPDGVSVPANPQMTWNAVPLAETYRVQVSTDPGFSAFLFNQTTYNTTYTPITELPAGTIYWRVAAINDEGTGPYSDANFTRSLIAPTPLTPADGATLTYPTDPPTFSWSSLASAQSYLLEIDDAADFIGATKITTNNTQYTYTQTQGSGQTYHWRVRGASTANGGGVLTDWSPTLTYEVTWPAVPNLVSPPDNTVNAITDIELVWDPVLGAAEYEIEVSLNIDFSGTSLVKTAVVGTRYTPYTTFLNGSYHWRVRAKDVDGHFGPYSATRSFTRGWPAIPTLTAPVDASFSYDPQSFTWTPVDHAGYYEVQVGSDPSFSPGTYASCYTNETTVMDYAGAEAAPSGCSIFDKPHGQTFYWRVRGIDDPAGVYGLWSTVRSFLRRDDIPTLTSPANGATVQTPVLTWTRVDNVERYRVIVTNNLGDEVVDAYTYANTYTPVTYLDPAEGPFTWYVITKGYDGNDGIIPGSGSWRSFSVSTPVTGANPTILTPASLASSYAMPPMTWSPVTDADNYEIWYSVHGTNIYTLLEDNLENAGYTHNVAPLVPNTYDWFVEAYQGNAFLGASSVSMFVVDNLAPAVLTGPADCPPNQSCAITSSPTFSWNVVPGAGSYLVYVSLDANFTNVVRTYTVSQNEFTLREELPDNDAGQAYFWHVRPCKASTRCNADPQGTLAPSRAFQKRSSGVVLTSPADGSSAPNQPTFRWEDYLASNPSNLEAEQYRIQVSTIPTFASTIDNRVVDQTYYTPFDRTYAEGPLYWRVRAIDGSGNELTWSATRTLTKTSPAPTMVAPAANANVTSVPAFVWTPQAYAAEYFIEVYKNADLQFSPANRIVTATTAHAEFTPADPLATGTYAWRIRRDDADTRDGPWSAGRLFTVTDLTVTLANPANGAQIFSNNLVFDWTTQTDVATYRFQRSSTVGFVSVTETATTVMNSWAPVVKVADGLWYWRVQALNADGDVIGVSAVRSFNKITGAIPSAPRSVSASSSEGRVAVSWIAPSNVGDPTLSTYQITLTPPFPMAPVVKSVGSNSTSVVFNGLINGTLYNVAVVAKNVHGTSPAGTTSPATPNGCIGTPFFDVVDDHPFCTEIAWLYTSGISTGSVLTDGTALFKPDDPVARQAMAAFMYRFSPTHPAPLPTQFFADVKPDHPFYTEIQWMAQTGLSTGTPQPSGKPLYKPDDSVSRMAMAAFLHRYEGGTPSTLLNPYFSDVGTDHPFYADIQWMADTGLSTGTPNLPGKPLYKPNAAVARQAMAAFLFRYDLEID